MSAEHAMKTAPSGQDIDAFYRTRRHATTLGATTSDLRARSACPAKERKCNVDEAFIEAITLIMSYVSLRE
jgi:hypothetical protein